MEKVSMEFVAGRHTKEIIAKAERGIRGFETFIEDLSDREKKIFEIAYANGYMDSAFDVAEGDDVPVLKSIFDELEDEE